MTGVKERANDLYLNDPVTGPSIEKYVIQSPATPYPIVPIVSSLPVFNGIINEYISMKLVFNGVDRITSRHLSYFTRQQLYEHHTASGLSTMYPDSIAVYSFSLRPEEHQPSGSCNFSRINVIQLVLESLSDTVYDFSDTQIDIYAVNYNIFRISSGMGSIAYSN